MFDGLGLCAEIKAKKPWIEKASLLDISINLVTATVRKRNGESENCSPTKYRAKIKTHHHVPDFEEYGQCVACIACCGMPNVQQLLKHPMEDWVKT